jgi:hypothetical protein
MSDIPFQSAPQRASQPLPAILATDEDECCPDAQQKCYECEASCWTSCRYKCCYCCQCACCRWSSEHSDVELRPKASLQPNSLWFPLFFDFISDNTYSPVAAAIIACRIMLVFNLSNVLFLLTAFAGDLPLAFMNLIHRISDVHTPAWYYAFSSFAVLFLAACNVRFNHKVYFYFGTCWSIAQCAMSGYMLSSFEARGIEESEAIYHQCYFILFFVLDLVTALAMVFNVITNFGFISEENISARLLSCLRWPTICVQLPSNNQSVNHDNRQLPMPYSDAVELSQFSEPFTGDSANSAILLDHSSEKFSDQQPVSESDTVAPTSLEIPFHFSTHVVASMFFSILVSILVAVQFYLAYLLVIAPRVSAVVGGINSFINTMNSNCTSDPTLPSEQETTACSVFQVLTAFFPIFRQPLTLNQTFFQTPFIAAFIFSVLFTIAVQFQILKNFYRDVCTLFAFQFQRFQNTPSGTTESNRDAASSWVSNNQQANTSWCKVGDASIQNAAFYFLDNGYGAFILTGQLYLSWLGLHFLFSLEFFSSAAAKYLAHIFLDLAFVGSIITYFFRYCLFSIVSTNQNRILYYRWYSIIEIAYLTSSIFINVKLILFRLLLQLIHVFFTWMRVDQFKLPIRMDFVYSSYAAVLQLEVLRIQDRLENGLIKPMVTSSS